MFANECMMLLKLNIIISAIYLGSTSHAKQFVESNLSILPITIKVDTIILSIFQSEN